jgi:hypothetical protein
MPPQHLAPRTGAPHPHAKVVPSEAAAKRQHHSPGRLPPGPLYGAAYPPALDPPGTSGRELRAAITRVRHSNGAVKMSRWLQWGFNSKPAGNRTAPTRGPPRRRLGPRRRAAAPPAPPPPTPFGRRSRGAAQASNVHIAKPPNSVPVQAGAGYRLLTGRSRGPLPNPFPVWSPPPPSVSLAPPRVRRLRQGRQKPPSGYRSTRGSQGDAAGGGREPPSRSPSTNAASRRSSARLTSGGAKECSKPAAARAASSSLPREKARAARAYSCGGGGG